jgi:glucose/mannose-6-phosphate isomerase
MGGSAMAGDLAADLAPLLSGHKIVPIMVVRDFQSTFALDQHSLVILCSYSGNTAETLCLFHQAVGSKAHVLVVSGGGLLTAEAKEHRIPILPIDLSGEPRGAVGYNLVLLLGVLHRLGLVQVSGPQVEAAIESLNQQVASLRPEVPTEGNAAKALARELVGKFILVYGGGLFSGVARRWKAQLNENAKAWAFFEMLPELLHNSVEAYRASASNNEGIMALLLQPNSGTVELKERYGVLAELLRRGGVSHRMMNGTPGTPLAELLGMLLLGDYVSYYLALLHGLNPSPTPNIDLVKERLASRRTIG